MSVGGSDVGAGGQLDLSAVAPSASSSKSRSSRSRSSGVSALQKIATGNLRYQAGITTDPMKFNLTQNKLQSGMLLASENLKRAEQQTAEKGQQIGREIYMQRGLAAASGAGTSPMAQFKIAQLYTQLIQLNRNLDALRQKTYIQNALANQQLELARNQYFFQIAELNQGHDFLNQQPPQPGQAFG